MTIRILPNEHRKSSQPYPQVCREACPDPIGLGTQLVLSRRLDAREDGDEGGVLVEHPGADDPATLDDDRRDPPGRLRHKRPLLRWYNARIPGSRAEYVLVESGQQAQRLGRRRFLQ